MGTANMLQLQNKHNLSKEVHFVRKSSRSFNLTQKVAHNAIVAASFIMSYSSKALVDDRLAGEGTGKGLGINDPILGWVILGVFTTVWALYTAATKELGCLRRMVLDFKITSSYK